MPAPRRRRIQGARQSPDMAFTVIGEFSFSIIMANDHTKALPHAFGGVAQHFKIAIRIAKGRNRAPANMARNADRLAWAIINEIHARFAQ